MPFIPPTPLPYRSQSESAGYNNTIAEIYENLNSLEAVDIDLQTQITNINNGLVGGLLNLGGTDLAGTVSAVNGTLILTADAATDTFTSAVAHALTAGQPIEFLTTGTLPTGLSLGVTYFVGALTSTTFKVYDTSVNAVAGGATGLINITTAGTGVLTPDGTKLFGVGTNFSGDFTVADVISISGVATNVAGRKISSVDSATKITTTYLFVASFSGKNYQEGQQTTVAKFGNWLDPNGRQFADSKETQDALAGKAALAHIHGGADIAPYGYINDKVPRWNNVSSIIIPAGLACSDDTDSVIMRVVSDITLSLATAGLSGLDTGSEAANTWYYPWIVRNPSTGVVGAIFSTSQTSPTLPLGFTQKRRLPFPINNNASSDLRDQYVAADWPVMPKIMYNEVDAAYFDGSVTVTGDNSIIAGGTGANGISCSNFVPPISRTAILATATSGGTVGNFRIRPNGGTKYPYVFSSNHASSTSNLVESDEREIRLGANQSLDYTRPSGTGTFFANVLGFITNNQ